MSCTVLALIDICVCGLTGAGQMEHRVEWLPPRPILGCESTDHYQGRRGRGEFLWPAIHVAGTDTGIQEWSRLVEADVYDQEKLTAFVEG